MRINKKKTALFLFVAVLLGMGTFVAGGNGQGNEAVKKKEVLGKAQIIVYKKGEKILIDPDAPYFRELQLACEEMLVPVAPESSTPDAYFHLLDNEYFKNILPDLTKLKKKEIVVEVLYASPVEMRIRAGGGIAIASKYKISLSGFMFPLSGEWVGRDIGGRDEHYFYTYIHLNSNFFGNLETTRRPEKIKNILSQYAIIP